jgi:hypothetical protein
MSTTLLAAIVVRYGGPKAPEMREIPVPEPGPGEGSALIWRGDAKPG